MANIVYNTPLNAALPALLVQKNTNPKPAGFADCQEWFLKSWITIPEIINYSSSPHNCLTLDDIRTISDLFPHDAVNGTPSHSYTVSLVIWDHTVLPVTRHKWTHPTLTAASRYSIYLPRRDGRLSWPRWLVTYTFCTHIHTGVPEETSVSK